VPVPPCPPQIPRAERGLHIEQPVKTGPHKSATLRLQCVNRASQAKDAISVAGYHS